MTIFLKLRLSANLFYIHVTIFKKMEMSECRNTGENASPASLVLPLVRRVSPALVFRYRLQSGTAGHGLIR
jgi:hypothetical protein